jgi:hypothetical protein
MNVINDLAYIINRHQLRYIDVLSNPNEKPTKRDRREWELFVGARDGKFKNDEEAAKHFKMDIKSRQFNRLKSDTKKKMMDTVLFLELETNEYTEHARRHQELVKQWSQCLIILNRGAVTTFLDIGQDCLKTALELENSSIILECAKNLMGQMARRPKYSKEFGEINTIVEKHTEIYYAELKMISAYNNFIALQSRKKGYKKEFAPIIIAKLNEFSAHAEKCTYPSFQNIYRILNIYSKTLLHLWEEAIEVIEDGLVYFMSKKYPNYQSIIMFNNQKVACLLMLGRYKEAKKTAAFTLPIAIEGTSSWFKTQELATANTFYAGWYEEAWETVYRCLHHLRFKELSPLDQETWRLYYAYLSILVRSGHLKLNEAEQKELEKFSMSAWLYELPIFSTDKRGSNIPILLLQIHQSLLDQQDDLLLNRIDALRKYGQRNLDPESEHYRTDLMTDLISLLPKHYNNLKALQLEAAPTFALLKAAPIDILDKSFETEVISYEQQWGYVLKAVEEWEKQLNDA